MFTETFRRAVLTLSVIALVTPSALAARTPRLASDQLDRYVAHYDLITLDAADLKRRALASGRVSFAAGLDRFDIQLEPVDLRAPGFRAQITNLDGSITLLPDAPISTFRGRVLNRPGAEARFSITDRGVTGFVLDRDETFFLEPLADFSLAASATDYVLYRASDLRPESDPGTCDALAAGQLGNVLSAKGGNGGGNPGGGGGGGDTGGGDSTDPSGYVLEVAVECDDEYVASFGSAQAAYDEVLSVINQVDAVYRNELNMQVTLTMQNSYSGGDPYTSTTNANTLVEEFRVCWNATMGSVNRDASHLFTGKDLDGSVIGIAFSSVVCVAPAYAYSLSQRYTSSPQKYVLTAHELGHNLGACHANTTCSPDPSASYNTIMQSSIASDLTFSQFSRDQIAAFVNTYANCLGSAPPAIPAAPQNLAGQAASRTAASLSWSDMSSNESGFRVERSTNGSSYSQIAVLGAGATSYTNTNLRSGRTYYYRVRAFNADGDSDASNSVSVTTPR